MDPATVMDRSPVDIEMRTWQGGRMSDTDRRTRISYGLMVFAVLFALTCVILIATGVVGPTVWFTVVAMALLALSQWLNIRARRRSR
ncbi:hypothetical protein [Microbacterium sp. ANT_H45B]|uniref:hypothetical protein n=1 Tax=unclassified Microbacterium TaxID=2609290 RepID=UPI0011F03037|nr:hypothetical protein [Microbacterium sp. ANT_H45B]KAA0960886.1 hypothetical protein FQ142_08370 [Microbacterium sp. ANT_H45B]